MNNPIPEDPWTRIERGVTPEQMDDELRERTNYGPSRCTLLCIILGALATLGFACFGAYRILCFIVGLQP